MHTIKKKKSSVWPLPYWQDHPVQTTNISVWRARLPYHRHGDELRKRWEWGEEAREGWVASLMNTKWSQSWRTVRVCCSHAAMTQRLAANLAWRKTRVETEWRVWCGTSSLGGESRPTGTHHIVEGAERPMAGWPKGQEDVLTIKTNQCVERQLWF